MSAVISAASTIRIRPSELFQCPKCHSGLSSQSNSLVCDNNHVFPWNRNVIDFSCAAEIDVTQKRSQQSFGIEWTQYYANLGWAPREFSVETEMFLTYTRAMPNFFANSIIVDAGCGNGRYINIINQIASPVPRLIIAVDLSDSIYVAAKNCSNFSNVLFLKMNLNLLPGVLKQPVDYVYSIGVLHHTPSAEAAFESLARCVKKSGFMSVYLYGKGNPLLYRVNSFLRNRLFQKWPHRLVYYLAVLIAIPSQLFRIRFFGPWALDFITRIVFISYDVHNMFDAYTAGYTSFHTKSEVEEWYRRNGFDCVIESQLNHTALYCIGRRN
jgi:SAM-dependent methyltransferase